MQWYWKVRIHNPSGNYAICQLSTDRFLAEIGFYQNFYQNLTGGKMLLEGMAEAEFHGILPLADAFNLLYKRNLAL